MYQRDGRFLAHANSEITVSLCSTRRLIMPSCGTPPSFLSADWLCSPSVPPIPRFLSLPIIIVLPVCLPTAVCHVSSSNLRDSGIQKFRSRSQTGAKNIAAIPRKLSCFRGDFFVIPDHCSLVCVCVCVCISKGFFVSCSMWCTDSKNTISHRETLCVQTTFTLSLNFEHEYSIAEQARHYVKLLKLEKNFPR